MTAVEGREIQLPLLVWEGERPQEVDSRWSALDTLEQNDGSARLAAPALPALQAAPQAGAPSEAPSTAGAVSFPTPVPDGPDEPGIQGQLPDWFPPDRDPDGTRRGLSRPMVAAAAAAGLVMLCIPLLMTHMGAPQKPAGAWQSPPTGYTQPQNPGDPGLVPSAAPTGGTALGAGQPPPVSGVRGAVGQSPLSGAQPGGVTTPGAQGASTAAVAAGGGNAAQGAAGAQVKGAAPSTAVTYSAVAGPGCGDPGAGLHAYGFYNQGRAGWVTHGGGYTGAGCNGQFVSMPMSGSATQDDPSEGVTWTFSTGPVTTGSCTVRVYVPLDSSPEAVGGSPAYYSVQGAAGTVGSFTVDQVAHRGAWVSVGSFRVSGGQLTVQLHSRGQDWNQHGYDYAHLAASATGVDCSA